jgi:catechol 2,3-dioxygenase-like lactoylglutathione lyase family enzyme
MPNVLRLYDHIDVRVRNVQTARSFYDPFCKALGLTEITESDTWIVYDSPDSTEPFLAIDSDPDFKPNRTRIAFHGDTRADVDRISAAAAEAGALEYEAPHVCPEYTPGYYASFFSDPDGNRYEVCCRKLPQG